MGWQKHEPNREYQDWELKEIVREYADDGTQSEYNERRDEDDPTVQTIIRRFGSWSNVLDDESTEITEPTEEEPDKKPVDEEPTKQTVEVDEFTREDCIRAADEVSQQVKGQLTFNEYVEFRDDSHPPKEAIGRHFRDWNELLDNLGDQFDRFEITSWLSTYE